MGDDPDPADAKSESDLSFSTTVSAVPNTTSPITLSAPPTVASVVPVVDENDEVYDADAIAVPPITPTAPPTAPITLAAAPPTAASVVTVVDENDEVYAADAIAEGCMLNTYKHIYFNVPVSCDAANRLYYVTRGRKIGVFSGWYGFLFG